MSIDFEPDALREKYQSERDKRVRADANEQYVEMKGQFAHYLDDPYVAVQERPALHDEVEVASNGFCKPSMLRRRYPARLHI